MLKAKRSSAIESWLAAKAKSKKLWRRYLKTAKKLSLRQASSKKESNEESGENLNQCSSIEHHRASNETY
jgi:hypothetical protein